jgi:hypothetical protein
MTWQTEYDHRGPYDDEEADRKRHLKILFAEHNLKGHYTEEEIDEMLDEDEE